MVIKGTWAEPCPECGALDGCCQSSKDRRDTADSLGKLVDRQSQTITKLTRELKEARQVIADLHKLLPQAKFIDEHAGRVDGVRLPNMDPDSCNPSCTFNTSQAKPGSYVCGKHKMEIK